MNEARFGASSKSRAFRRPGAKNCNLIHESAEELWRFDRSRAHLSQRTLKRPVADSARFASLTLCRISKKPFDARFPASWLRAGLTYAPTYKQDARIRHRGGSAFSANRPNLQGLGRAIVSPLASHRAFGSSSFPRRGSRQPSP